MSIYRYTKLPNNMQIITKQVQSGIATISMFVKTGTKYEKQKNNGISHYIEHLSINSLKLKDANVNGNTTKEMTSYIFQQENKNLKENLCSILLNLKKPIFGTKHLFDNIKNKELENIRKEIEDVKNNKIDLKIEREHSIFDTLMTSHSLKLPILGKIKILENLSRSNLLSYYKKQYRPSNVLFVIESDLSHKEVVKTFLEKLNRITIVVDGYTNNKHIKYLVIKEMFNCKNMECFYLPYIDSGLFSYKYDDVDFDSVNFENAKKRVIQALYDIKNNQPLLNEEIAYHRLYLNKDYNIELIIKQIEKIDYSVIKTILDNLLGKEISHPQLG